MIKEFEDFEPKAYPDPGTGGLPITIGWGSTRNFDGKPFKLGDTMDREYGDRLFDHQIRTDYLPRIQKIPYWNEMNDKMRSALLSFAYNNGAAFYGATGFDTITRVLMNKEWHKVADAMKLYYNPYDLKVRDGLLRRRIKEGKLWNEGLNEIMYSH